MSTLGIQLVFLVLAVMGFCVSVALIVATWKAKGDGRRKRDRILFLSVMGLCVIMGCSTIFQHLQTGGSKLLLVIILSGAGLALVVAAYGLWSLRTEAYFQKLYEHDPGYCGRCGYNLTGNTSGVCPECGWKLPDRQG